MKYIGKILMAIVVLCMLLTLAACGQTPSDNTNETPAATATVTPNAPTPTPDDGKVTYTVKVVDENNNPLANVMVQLCLESCFPGLTDANGVATFSREEADYKVGIVSLPAGYTYSSDVTDFYYEEGSTDMTIVLKATE